MSATELNDSPMVLAIAGFDPSGGAGIISDIGTLLHFGCRPAAAITSLTFQNHEQFFGAAHQSPEVVRAQVEAVAVDDDIAALKIGMLPVEETVREVARLITELKLPAPVIDPVMQSTSGGRLMSDDAFEVFVTQMLPLARLVTPNIPEAEKLAGLNVRDEEDMRQAAARIRELGPRAVLIKGGHLKQGSVIPDQGAGRGSSPTVREGSGQALDVLDDDGQLTIFRGEWIDAQPVRGTGCMLSSAIAAHLARGASLSEAVAAAKNFVAAAIHNSKPKTQN
jgi:hydroxymethylpyrimidine kinase/phosphomethylpyrimidine kinase